MPDANSPAQPDVAVYIALSEEFDHVVETLPVKPTVEEDPELSLTYYTFKLPSLTTSRSWNVLIVSAGAMGPPRAAAITAHVNQKFHPKNIAVLGISGSLDKDLLLGDVCIPKAIENYLSVGAAIPDGPDAWQLRTSGNTFRSNPRLLDRIRSFKHAYSSSWAEWKQDTAILSQELLGDSWDDAVQYHITRKDAILRTEEATLASGELLGKSTEFVKWLKTIDRKFVAIDMESSGVMELSDLIDAGSVRFISIRGISDFADERKSLVESKYSGAFRQIAVENACTFLWSAIQANLFSDEITSAPPEESPTTITARFAKYLTENEVTFQHRHKKSIYLSDLFIFPDLMTLTDKGERSQDRLSSSTLSDVASLSDKTIVIGDEQTGKTSLLKMLFLSYFEAGALPLLVNGAAFRTANYQKSILTALRQQYGRSSSDPAAFQRAPTVVFIDDFDDVRINQRHQQKLLDYLSTTFDKVVLIGSTNILLADTQFATFAGFKCFEILPFGHSRRADLISKWITLGRETSLSETDVLASIDTYEQHINSIIMKNIVPAKPFFICTILQTFESTLPSDYSLTSYGHCYQSLIVQTFIRAGVKPGDIDSHVNYLTELSFFMMRENITALPEEKFQEFSHIYESNFLTVPGRDMKELLFKVGILRFNQDEEIEFSYRYIYYFYCSKYLCEHFDRADIQASVQDVCSSIHLESNACIVIFMTHHSRDNRLIDEILLHTMMRFSGTPEARLDPEETAHFIEYEKEIPQLVIEQRDAREERRKVAELRDQIEEEDEDGDSVTQEDEPTSIEEKEAKDFFAELHSSARSIDILGQILCNRAGSFDRAQLTSISTEAINVGLRVLKRHLEISAENKEGIVEMIGDLMAHDSSLTDAEVSAEAKNFYLLSCYWTVVSLITRISYAVGFKQLLPIFKELAEDKNVSVAMRLLYITIYMRAKKSIPKNEIRGLYETLGNDALARRMLRQIVLRHLYLNQADYRDKQWLSSVIELPVKQQILIERGDASKR